MGQFNPFVGGSINESAVTNNYEYTIKKQIDDNGKIYYQLIQIENGTEFYTGDKILFSAQDLQFDQDNTIEQIINSLIQEEKKINDSLKLIENKLNNVVQKKTFEEFNIDTKEKNLDQIINELDNTNVSENIIITGTFYEEALPTDTELALEDATVQVTIITNDNGDRFYKFEATSDKVSPYSWTAIYKNNDAIIEWTPTYNGTGGNIDDLKNQILNHIHNNDIHVTKEEKNFWNTKVSAIVEETNECLTFYDNQEGEF